MAVGCVESPARGGRPHAQALSPGPHELSTSGDLQQPPLDTCHGLITQHPAQPSDQHQERLSPCCGAGRGPPSGLGVLQDPKAPGGRTTQAPTRRREMLYAPPCESSRQQGTVQLVLALSTPGPPDLAHPATTTPPTTAKLCALGPTRQDSREGLALKLSSLLPSCTPPKTTSHHQPKF